jgi:hypothetical protein
LKNQLQPGARIRPPFAALLICCCSPLGHRFLSFGAVPGARENYTGRMDPV